MPRQSLFYVSTEGVECRSFPCRDIRFYVATGNGHSKGFDVATKLALGRVFVFATKYFMSQQSMAKLEVLCCNREF